MDLHERIAELEQKLNEATLECDVIRDQIKYWNDKCREVTALATERRQFILNGVEMGFIRLPDESTNDPATATHQRCLLESCAAGESLLNSLRAEGIEAWIASRNGAWNGTTKQAEQFAAQLRNGEHVGEEGV